MTPSILGPPTEPGQMALTRIPAEPSSIAHVFVRPITAHFAAAYGERSGYPKMPALDEMLTMDPCAWRSIGTARWVQRNIEPRLMRTHSSNACGSISSTAAVGPATPTLL